MAKESLQQESIDNLWALRDLPPFPWIVTKVLQLFAGQGDDVEINRLIQLVRADASLSSEILRRANSALYGLKSQISSLQHAVVLLGLDHVKTLSMTIGVGAYLKAALKLRILRRCWRHSLSCALLSEDLAAACGIPSDQAYTSGLLHDIGRLALLVKYPGPYADLLSVAIENHFGLLSSERELFDIDHCQAGAWLAEQWNFPDELKRAVAKHHDPPRNGALDLLKLIHLSCRLADSLGFQVGDPAELEEPVQILAELPKSALSRLQIDLTTLKETLTNKVNALE